MNPWPTDFQLTSRQLDELAIFPLPDAVLFPGSSLPLHVFEPRYRAMVEHCLRPMGGGVLAVATLMPGYEAQYAGRPPVFPVMGAGIIVDHAQLPDGRFHILLQGLTRIRLVEELTADRPFRLVRAEVMRDVCAPGDCVLADRLRRLLWEMMRHLQKNAESLVRGACAISTPGLLADKVAAALLSSPEARQRVLEEQSVGRRLQLLCDALSEALLEQAVPDQGSTLN